MLVWLILCYHVLPGSGSQLDKLIQFAHGNGANPSSGSSTRASSPPAPRAGPAQTSRYTVASAPTFQPRQPQPRQQPPPAPARALPVVQNRPIPPIPFSDYAPDSKLRVSQPRAPVQSSRKLQYSSKQTSRTQSSSRLPTGFVQIGGAPVKILRSKPKSVTKPATNLPVTRPSTFISRPPPPAYSTLNNHHAPRRPVPIAQQKQPVINVISNPFHQPEAKEYRSNSQPINNVPRPSSNRGQSFIQADDAHRLALEEHNAQIEKVKNLQKQRHHTTITQPTIQQHQQLSQQPHSQTLSQPQHIQQSYSKPVTNRPSLSTSSHFNIPGRDAHSQYAAELKLAQDALRSLG